MAENQPPKKEYVDKKPGHVIKSGGVKDITGQPIDYAVFTDNGQGIIFNENGDHKQHCRKTSYDLSGTDPNMDKNDYAKVIRAKKGDIQIEALDGDIVIKANNIRIVGLDGNSEVTITSGKHVSINSPIQSFKGTNMNTVMSNSVSLGAQTVESTGNIQNATNNAAEEKQASILTQILGVVKKFKSFFD
jgi:hypothetical protein